MDYSDSTRPPPLPPSYANPAPSAPAPEARGGGIGANFFQSCLVAGCATVLAPVILVGGFLLVMGIVLSSGIDGDMAESWARFDEIAGGAGDNLQTRVLRPGAEGAGTIALVTVQGTITGNGSPLEGDGSMIFVADQLRAAAEDDRVKAVILQIDSPGGGLTASDHLHQEVTSLRKTDKLVIAWAGSMMASGGYYVAVAADQIMASPTATVGSIGVILQHFQVSDLLDTLGIRVNPITSGEHKDLASPFRDMTPAERAILQDYIDIAHNRFVDIVANGRGLPREEVEAVANGDIMGAEAALEKNLVDSIGYIGDAVALVESELGESDMRLVSYRRVFSFADMFAGAGASAAGAAVKALRGGAEAGASPKAMAVY